VTGLRYISGVPTIELDRTKCSGCRMCLKVCPHPVFGFEDGKALLLDSDLCMECGACVKNCPESALSVHPGVGCAAAILNGWITRREPHCCG